ncbi:flavin-containing monooxygenase [Pseudoalteromonas denitrificans]|uniref:Predicted flavoprotein CzcO associated with the cation diffusion facilitator CzcD n=1 Tax=Pseudoalteromonas denitrificans DSM 6059 TaxID=1123010 RepID=A0A1I1I670_9GAMM|nr:NAD(P)/FAD-dependent oxidoreductase [Pseudoalteromonas denitrificans]SFC31591.1 Predicted flavoprotein CzcO associated with the cation diffusion facilitator CzcD [Pseudoalteromonas denitrificans DSM 6059]
MKKDAQYFETIIIGTGFSGLLAAIGLKKKNNNDFVLLERGSDIGGTWRDNSYPGAEVDIPTGLYSISFIPYKFKKKYSPQSELLEYTNYIIDKFDIRRFTKTNQSVAKLTYSDSECLWHVVMESGENYIARFIIDTSGVLANPKTPEIEGAESFQGTKFHTAKWDHSVPYDGKRVGIIGSGCSAAQAVPVMASKVDKLTVFMGKAQWVIPRSDRSYSKAERFITNLPVIRHIKRLMIFSYHEVRFAAFRRYPFTLTISKFIKYLYARTLRKNLEKYIVDEKLRKHMMPDYELGGRRVIPTNKYLPALSRDNVDVDISGIERITPTGIRTKDGKEIPLDIIVYATGFYAYSNMKKALSFQVYGSRGRHLNKEWETEAVSYKGIITSGYPNYFKVNGPNTGTGHSSQLCYMEAMVNYTIKAICAVKRDKSIKAIDVKSHVQKEYVAKMKNTLKLTVWQSSKCSAFYRKNMTGEVTSLSPESVVNFIFSRKWFRLKDYNLLK